MTRPSSVTASRRPVVALLLLALPLAGCVGGPGATADLLSGSTAERLPTEAVLHGPGGALLNATSEGVERAVGVQRDLGFVSFEPTLGVNAEGVMFMTAFAEGTRQPTVVRSRDQGLTWEDVGPRLPTGHRNPPITGDPYVYVDPGTGRVFTSDLQLCNYMSWSDDEGATWFTHPLPCGHPVSFDDHQTLVAAKPRALPTVGYDNVLYYCINRIVDAACATSLNGGLTWGPFIPTWPTGLECGNLHGHVVASAEGIVYLGNGGCDGGPQVAWSEDDGLTWSRATISDKPSDDHEVSLAVDEAGHVHALWISDGLPLLASSLDGGRTWTDARMVGAPGVTASDFPAIAAGAQGRLVVAYVATAVEGGYEGKTLGGSGVIGDPQDDSGAEDWADASWNAYMGLVTLDAEGNVTRIETVTANDPADPVARGVCGRTRCFGIGDFIHAEVAPDGRPWVAFVDVCTKACVDDAKVQHDDPMGFVGTLLRGPSLRGAADAMLPGL